MNLQMIFMIVVGLLAMLALSSIVFGLIHGAASTGPNLRDAGRKLTRALPNGAATVYATPGLDSGVSTAQGTQPGEMEYLLTAPAMTTAQMPDAKTMIYSILTDSVDPIDGSSTVLMPSVITQTGAGGVGCAAATYRFRLPSNAARILGFKAVGSASGDASGATATLEELV